MADDDKTVTAAKVRDLWGKGNSSIRHDTLEYRLNERFLTGDQWVYIAKVTNSINDLPRDPDRVRLVINRMWPASRTIISKLTSRPLVYDVPPTAADDATLRAAKMAESILRSLGREHDWEGLREDNFWSVWKGGTAALCVEWDPDAGTPLGLQDNGKSYGTGDTKESSLSILDFCVEPGVKDAETARWWIRTEALPPDHVKDRFNLADTPQADANAHRANSFAVMGNENAVVDMTLVLTYSERPCKGKGGTVVSVVADEVVERRAWPFPFKDRLNLVINRETRLENRWTGETVLKIARPVQVALNQAWSSKIEHTKLAGNARMAFPESAIDRVDQLTDLPGELMPWPDNTQRPEWISPPNMQGALEEAQQLANELDDILGVHDASRGAAPANIESGLGLSILVEQDATPLGRMTKESALSWGRFASLVLKIYQAKVKEQRTATVTTPGQPPETTQWTGKDLQNQTTAIVPLDAVMPRSKAQQTAMAEKMMEMGLIPPGPAGLVQFLRISEHPDAEGIVESLSPDVAKSRRENAMMWLERPATPEMFDDHNTHVQEHLTAMKSPRWDLCGPAIRSIFQDHMKAHSHYSAEQLGKAAQRGIQNPLAATIADADGGPVIPMEALATLTPGQEGAAPPPLDMGPVTEAAGELAGAISQQNPSVDPALIEESV